MSERRFTAPHTGWYRLVPGYDPEHLDTEQPTSWPAGSTAVIRMDSDIIMNNSDTLTREEPSLVIPWDHE